jgi:formylglycine-generating enzyme required for sulfatase activity
MKRKLAIPVAGLLLVGTAAVVWVGLDLPPPGMIWRYGLTPWCEPTGEIRRAGDIEFVMIGPGIFRMGSDAMLDREGDDGWSRSGFTKGSIIGRLAGPLGIAWGDAPNYPGEMPRHWVEFPGGFGIARYEVTNADYARFDEGHMRSESSQGDRDPVVEVDWDDARRYCAWLAKESGLPVRLPTEAEWEVACRAGAATEYAFGDDEGDLGEYAWYRENSEGRVHEVGTRKENAWGLFDLHGNVWEWCADAWHDSYRLTERVTGPEGTPRVRVIGRAPRDGTAWEEGGSPFRVVRGSGWNTPAVRCRSAYRGRNVPSNRWYHLGFRPAISAPSED